MRQTIEAERTEPSADDRETAPTAAGLAAQQVAAAPEADDRAADDPAAEYRRKNSDWKIKQTHQTTPQHFYEGLSEQK